LESACGENLLFAKRRVAGREIILMRKNTINKKPFQLERLIALIQTNNHHLLRKFNSTGDRMIFLVDLSHPANLPA
jgi:hypothetical protein